MKKRTNIYFFIALFLTSCVAYGQKKFDEGTIVYNIKLEADKPNKMASMLPSEMVMKIKGDKSRTEMATGMMETVALSDNRDNSGIILMDIMGNKYAMKMDEKLMAAQKEKMPDYAVLPTNETKVIAGYPCKLVKMIDNKNGDTVSVYYTDLIPYYSNTITSAFNAIKGMPLEFSTSLQGIKMKVTVTSILPGKLEDKLFAVPVGYKVVTQEEMMKDLSGN